MLQRLNQNIFKQQKIVPLGKLLQRRGQEGSSYRAAMDASQGVPGRRTADHGTGPLSSGAVSDASLPQSFRNALDQFDAQYEQPENVEFAASVSQWPIHESNL